ncbi:Lysine 6-dehydrogenase [Mycobacterium simulans]|uniref:Lysine 6-dehydrogenase n=1 Tax=Mycobacterium simulans TaxID=627089 RepID=A0A7Z7IPS2_9MYCO|nr:saccharopine dehydrogenase NADP-binding domain-containing protein [Mycobacterium simulans]SOJ57557.1 Lysine 6-dehydrogenase [Mycobacterium simulans]
MKNVLLLGSTGAVGRACLDVLAERHDMYLAIAGRDEARLREVASAIQGDVELARLDVTDAAAVAAAVRCCDVVINCAGPSQRLSAQVAEAAIDARVPYVDPGGDQALLDRIRTAAVPVVLQAGVQPGLSGLLLRVLAPQQSDDITAWCGGLQPLTPASVLEYMASLHDTHSHPGAVLRDGAIRRVSRAECKPAPAQHFPGSVSVHPHLDAETIAVAAHLGVGNICWMNVFDGKHTTHAIQLLAVDNERQHDLDAVLAAAKLDLFGRRPYFAIVATAGADVGCKSVAFTCTDSYRVTGALTAFAAQHVAGMPAGAHPFWSVNSPHRALEFLTEAVPGAEVSFAEASPAIEEGFL